MADENQSSPDVYPLGQGGGLMKDIINFALNNLYQYGEKLGKESQSNAQALESLRAGKPSNLSTAALQPMIGPNVVGQISPTNWAAYSPEAKAILTETFNKFPRLFERVQKTPSNLHVSVAPGAELATKNASGVMRSVSPYFDEIQLAKTQRIEGTGQPNRGVGDTLNWRSVPADEMRPDLQTTVHELQHHINAPRLLQKSPADAADQATIGMLLKEIMYNKDIGSLHNRYSQYKTAALDPNSWNMPITSPHKLGVAGGSKPIPGINSFEKTPWSQS